MTEKKYERYYGLAGKASFENWKALMSSKLCGCYHCGSIFKPEELTDNDWIQDLHGRTAVCPKCGIDAVIGDVSGIPIRKDVLDELYDEKFGITPDDEPFARIVGSGIYNPDTIVFDGKVTIEEVGGTCGNVMCMLANLGLETYPQACLDDSPEGFKVKADLERYGCDTRFVTNTPDGGTTLLRVNHRRNPDGTRKVSVRVGSPGGSRFPKRKFLRMRDQAPAFVQALTLDFIPHFYFFEDPAAGHRAIARELKRMGTTVYFEPSRIATNADLECVALSDIVKFSDENVPDVSFANGFSDKLFVQTCGKDGLRYKFRGGAWMALPPVVNKNVVDTDSAGDWATSGLIFTLVRSGKQFADLDEDDIVYILTEAQHFASESISYMGTKGGTLIGAKSLKFEEPCNIPPDKE